MLLLQYGDAQSGPDGQYEKRRAAIRVGRN